MDGTGTCLSLGDWLTWLALGIVIAGAAGLMLGGMLGQGKRVDADMARILEEDRAMRERIEREHLREGD